MSNDRAQRIPWLSQTRNGQVLLSPSWEVFILGVSILSVVNLFLVVLIGNPDIELVVVVMESVLTVVFVADIARRLVVADDDRAYLVKGAGWVDLLSIVPILRIFRLLRIYRASRVLQRLGGPAQALRAYFSDKAAGGLLSVILIAILVVEFGSLLILWVERGAADANIVTAQDAVWYLLVTISTVGYGHFFPVTDAGRLIGSLIILVGVGVFGTLTGFLANLFLSPSDTAAAAQGSSPARTHDVEAEAVPTDG